MRSLRSLFAVSRKRRIALAMVFAVLFGGIVQAAHFHKDDYGARGEVHATCLLCTYATGCAGPPTLPCMALHAPQFPPYLLLRAAPLPDSIETASYDARGPPLV